MNFLKWFSRKNVQPMGMAVFSEAGDPKRSSLDYRGYSEEGYRKCVIAFRCVNIIAGAVAKIPWVLYRVSDNGDRTEVTKHPVLRVLKRPNPAQSAAQFQRQLVSYFLISGNGFVHAPTPDRTRYPGQGNEPGELWTLQPDKMRVIPGTNGLPARFEYRPQFSVIDYPVGPFGQSAILHLKTFNPQTVWEGMSPIEAAALGVDTLNAGALWNLRLMQNSAKPSLFIKVEGQVNDVQFERLTKDVQERYQGPWKAGLPMVLKNADVKQVSWTPVEMDWLNSKKTSEKDVALVFGVPSEMVGIEGQTYENQKEARLAFYQDTVLPLKYMLAESLGAWLLPAYPDGERLELGIDEDCIEALEPIRETKFKRAQESDFLTLNEKREMVGFGRYTPDSEDPGDRILVATSLVSLETAAAVIEDEPVTDLEDETGAPPAEDDVTGSDDEGEEKALDMKSAAGRRRYWESQDRRKLAQARGLRAKALSQFGKDRDAIASRLTGVDPTLHELVIGNVLTAHEGAWKALLRTELTETARAFGKDVLEQFKSSLGVTETKAPADRFEFSIARFLESRIESTVSKMSATTRRRLMKALKDAQAERDEDGHQVQVDLVTVVKGAFGRWSESRAEALSRTETHIAAEEGKREAAKSLGIPNLKKEWISVKDDRVRDSHAKVDGTVIPVEEKFRVESPDGGPEDMEGPGDKSASAANVINCRCVLAYVAKE